MNVNKEILSFKDIPSIAEDSRKSVLLIRHSYRETLKNGLDPGLTKEGWEYAVECGKLLKGLKNVSFGASHRKRTIETVRAVMEGGELGAKDSPIAPCPLLYETAIFTSPESLDTSLRDNTLPEMLKSYFTTGCAPGMVKLHAFGKELADFLTGTDFGKKNVLLASHDVILMTLLMHFAVYDFHMEDWCAYLQGAFLRQDDRGEWTIFYAVPDKEKRIKHKLFL